MGIFEMTIICTYVVKFLRKIQSYVSIRSHSNNNSQLNIQFTLLHIKGFDIFLHFDDNSIVLAINIQTPLSMQNFKLEKNLEFSKGMRRKRSSNFLPIRLLNRHQHAKIYQILLCGVNVNWTFRWASLLLVMTLL